MKKKPIIPMVIGIIAITLAINYRSILIQGQSQDIKKQNDNTNISSDDKKKNDNNENREKNEANTFSADPSDELPTQPPLNKSSLLDVPIIKQNPGLYNGCEVTSLAMLLKYKGIAKSDKMTLARLVKKDSTPLVRDKSGNIIRWGDPNYGFVGDITGKKPGYGVYDKPLLELLEKYMPGKSVNLTGKGIDSLFRSIQNGNPVVVWVTVNYNVAKKFVTWEKDGKDIKATFSEHAVLLVGYDEWYCYVNNPYNGRKNEQIKKEVFEKVWESMGSMAISST